MIAFGRTPAIVAATAASSVRSRSTRVNGTTSWAGENPWTIAPASWPPAPATATRTLRGLLFGKRAHLPIVEHAFPPRDDGRRNAVAHHVHGRAAHVHDLVDAHDDSGTLERQPELRQRRREHNQRCPRHAGDTLARQHQRQHHDDLLTERHVNAG